MSSIAPAEAASVLLVDATDSYRGVVASILAQLGFHVTEAGDAEQAERAMKAASFEVAVVDEGLPDRRGADLVPALLALGPSTRILLVIGPESEMASCRDLCDEIGASLALRGPLHPHVLAQRVELLATTRVSQLPDDADQLVSDEVRQQAELAEQQLREVRRDFQERLPFKLDLLADLMRRARSESFEPDLFREMLGCAHALHGTAGTLGFGEVSSVAARVEQAAKQVLAGAETSEIPWDGLDTALERAREAPEKLSLLSSTPVRPGGIATVLVVDDDPDMVAAITEIGRRQLVSVSGATTPEQALARTDEIRFDGAIIDINLGPGVSPFELAEELRSVEGSADLPIAFMSADGSVPNRVAAAAAGATLFLKKPIDPHDLGEAVRGFAAARTAARPRVMVVDDDEFFRGHISSILVQQGMGVTSLGDPVRMLEIIDQVKPDLMLLDVNMPEIDGYDVCRMLRSTGAWRELPVLFLTGETGAEARLKCFRAGGDDYIEKPVIREELLARIGVRLERARLFRDRADRDALTGLPNRRAFLELFKLRVADGQRHDRPVSLCVIDLDRFKRINDEYGHLCGDRVLASMGKLLASRFRTVDVRGRWGGEEFAVAFYGEDRDTARMIIGRVLEDFRAIRFEGDDGREFRTSFSAGVATFPDDGRTFDELFRAADQRLYEAKESGRDQIR